MSAAADLAKLFPHLDADLIKAILAASKGDVGRAKASCQALAPSELPPCPHGAACYRRSKAHLAQFRHDATAAGATVAVAAVAAAASTSTVLTRKRTASLRKEDAVDVDATVSMAPGELPVDEKAVSVAKKAKVEPVAAASARRTPCPFGSECYRKNKAHRAEQSHPGDADWSKADDKELAAALHRSASLALHPPSSPDTMLEDDPAAQEFVERMLAFQRGEDFVPKATKPAAAAAATAAAASSKPSKPVDKKPAAKPTGKIHAGRVFALTGAMSRVRTEIVREIESRGGEVKASVTATVTHLIAADPHSGSSKLEKARAAGIVVVGEAFIYSGDEASTKLPETTGDEDDDDYVEAAAAAGPPAWLVAEVTVKGVVPKHCMKSGETTTVGVYTLKRVHDHYYCTCTAWKQQKASVDARTCKHLREHLGAEYEAARVFGGGDASGASGVVRPTDTTHDAVGDVKIAAPALLLANKFTETMDPTGWHMSEKLDGVRAYWTKGMLVSRNGNKFFAPDWFVAKLPVGVDLDGELFAGRGKFQQAVSIARTHDSARWAELTYEVFDMPALKEPFEARMLKLDALIGGDRCGAHVRLVKQTPCRSREHLMAELKAVELLKGEGLMIRQPKSLYVGSRSSTLLKVKTFLDADAKVVGHEPGKGKYTGQCGALKCAMLDAAGKPTGKEFRCGSGMTDADRVNPPPVGTIVIYRYFELTPDGVPRFPSFVGVRGD
jgi:hypothetical protein